MNRSTVSWQPPSHFRIVPMKTALEPYVRELEVALDSELQIVSDVKRRDFFNIVTDEAWFYVHVHREAIYLVGHQRLSDNPEDERRPEESSTTDKTDKTGKVDRSRHAYAV